MVSLTLAYSFWLFGFVCIQAGTVVSLVKHKPLTDCLLPQVGWLCLIAQAIIDGLYFPKLILLAITMLLIYSAVYIGWKVTQKHISWDELSEYEESGKSLETRGYSGR